MPYKKGKGLVAAALVASLCLLPGLVPAPVRAAGEARRADTRALKQADWQLARAYGRPMLDVAQGADTILDRRRYRPARWSISSVSAILTPN